MQVWSAIGREFTLATNQVDFAVPARFGLTYRNSNNEFETPICIHRAPLGTHERFIGFLIEHFAGNFPIWLAPKQVAVLPISDKYLDYAKKSFTIPPKCRYSRPPDDRDEKIGKKIRDSELKKVPYMLIVGEKKLPKTRFPSGNTVKVILAASTLLISFNPFRMKSINALN